MQNDASTVLDEMSLRILLVLSSKQALSIAEIARAVDLDEQNVSSILRFLQHKHFIAGEKGKYKISREGINYLYEKGMSLPKLGEASKKINQDLPIPLFGSWNDVLIWFGIVSALIILLFIPILYAVNYGASNTLKVFLIVISVSIWLAIIIFLIKNSFLSVPEYERRVIFRLGKCIGAKGPGLIVILPFLDKTKSVDLRVRHQEVPHEMCITQDNVQINVDFVFYWKIQQPVWSVTKVTDPEESIRLLATALLRAVIAHFPFNDVLNKRESINDMLKEKIDEISSEWGVYVTTMEIREIQPPEEIVKSMHKQREAEWLRQATVISADAQAQALRLLYEIANVIDDKTLSLKYFEMLKDLGQGESTKYIFPLELTNLVKPLLNALGSRGAGSPAGPSNGVIDSKPDENQG